MAVQQPSTSLQKKLQQAATAGQLGSLLESYGASGTARLMLVLGIILLLILVGSIVSVVQSTAGQTIIPDDTSSIGEILIDGAFLLLFLACTLLLVYLGLRSTWQKVYLFQHGFIVIRWGRLSVYPWTQIQTIRQRITRVYRQSTFGGNKYMGTRYIYTIQRADGKTLKLDGVVQDIAELGEAITRRFNAFFFPTALASLTTGATVTFGPWSIDLQGIRSAKGMLPWSAVGDYSIIMGRIHIFTNKRALWASHPVQRIPNVFVFIALVDYMRKTQNKT